MDCIKVDPKYKGGSIRMAIASADIDLGVPIEVVLNTGEMFQPASLQQVLQPSLSQSGGPEHWLNFVSLSSPFNTHMTGVCWGPFQRNGVSPLTMSKERAETHVSHGPSNPPCSLGMTSVASIVWWLLRCVDFTYQLSKIFIGCRLQASSQLVSLRGIVGRSRFKWIE